MHGNYVHYLDFSEDYINRELLRHEVCIVARLLTTLNEVFYGFPSAFPAECLDSSFIWSKISTHLILQNHPPKVKREPLNKEYLKFPHQL